MLEPTAQPDESIATDLAISEEFRRDVFASRAQLLDIIGDALRATPTDDFLRGQIVRFLIDQGQLDSAKAIATACAGSNWWCGVLKGYVLARASDGFSAELAYDSALRAMPAKERCDWNDISALLDNEAAKRFRALGCSEREAFVDRVWWLADPMLSESGNPRRLEHFLRRTFIALRKNIARDERFDWSQSGGAPVRSELITRYGLPTFSFWGRDQSDRDYSMEKRGATRPNAPLVTYEYSSGRIATIPAAPALADPVHASSSDWFLGDTATSQISSWRDERWWPQEHFSPSNPLVQLFNPQVAFLRRQDSVVLALAVELPSARLNRTPGARVDHLALVQSTSADSTAVVAKGFGIVEEGVAVWGMARPVPSIVGLEFSAPAATKPGGRTRMGVVPPPPLTTMTRGAVAISQPVILRAGRTASHVHPDSALRRMATSNRLRAGTFDIYWETYGFADTDTMQLAVWLERFTEQGIARRFSNALQLTQDLNTPVIVNWVEPVLNPRSYVISGPIRVVGREMTVDVSGLPAGRYWLEVAASARGKQIVGARRELIIEQ